MVFSSKADPFPCAPNGTGFRKFLRLFQYTPFQLLEVKPFLHKIAGFLFWFCKMAAATAGRHKKSTLAQDAFGRQIFFFFSGVRRKVRQKMKLSHFFDAVMLFAAPRAAAEDKVVTLL